ncbi:unnamed protein product, partial [Vitis vinifera]
FVYTPEIPFCSNKWTNTENQIHPSLLNNLHKLEKIVPSPKVILKCLEKVHGHSRTHIFQSHRSLLP